MNPAGKDTLVAIDVWGVGGGAFSNVAALLAKGLTAAGVDADTVYLKINRGGGTREGGPRDEGRELRLSDVVSMPGFVFNPMPCLARADVFASSSEG